MDHPLRTLLYELFVEPFLRLLQRPFRRTVNALPTRNDVEAGGMKDEQVSKVESSPTSNCRRQLLPNNAPL